MGRSRVLRRGLIPLLLLLAACGGDDDLLVAEDLSIIYSGGGGGGDFGPDAKGGAPGRITGKVRFQGNEWQRKKLDITTADQFCVRGHQPDGLMSETFLMGANGALGNVVVYLKEGASGGKWETPTEPLVLDQVKCQYVPHVAVLQLGQPLVIKSEDETLHNVHMIGPAVPGGEQNLSMSHPSELKPMVLKRPEVALRVWCEVHNWMEAWIAIVPHPFHAITGADGTFTIENVPPGKYLLAAWHEKFGEKGEQLQEVVVPAGGTATVEDFVFTR